MNPTEMKAVENAMNYVMPWGRYRGKTLDEIPISYLRWLAERCTNPIIASHADTLWRWKEEYEE